MKMDASLGKAEFLLVGVILLSHDCGVDNQADSLLLLWPCGECRWIVIIIRRFEQP